MALSRIGLSANLTLLGRSTCAARPAAPSSGRPRQQLHASVVRHYPEAPRLPLPSNVCEIFNTETGRFGPERARDIATPVFLYGEPAPAAEAKLQDSRLESYDCFGAVSLNSSMQSNVPKPFCGGGRSTYLNMPGGQWARDDKYLAEGMRRSHFTVYQMRHFHRSGGFLYGLAQANPLNHHVTRYCSTDTKSTSDTKKKIEVTPESKKQRLKAMIQQYGWGILGFHISISLVSLGICYYCISRGLDVNLIIEKICDDPENQKKLSESILAGGSTFLIAYGIHKLFGPVRITITLACAPLIVRYLRGKGFLKPLPSLVVKK